ncbi:MAG TPA: lytic transglycosylase domain-containing protein [Bryobacteraceae bacterium]|nr:lytic transglycosylase domain-containing protein [Bryobacteraceae bacterium]
MRFCSENILRTALLGTLGAVCLCGETAAPEPSTAPAEVRHVVSVVRADARTGRLVRRIVVSPKPEAQTTPDPVMVAVIDETAKNLQVSPELVHSVIEVESNYDPYAVSPKGAEGLMQLMPATARRFGVTNSFDARQNIEAGVRYLKFLQDTFQDDRLAIAAYNAGEKAVARYGDVPPYPETVSYVAKVGEKYSRAKKSAAAGKAEKGKIEAKAAAQPASDPAEDETHHVIAYLDTEGRLHIATR